MRRSLEELLDPASTALVTHECMRGVIGEPAVFPALSEEARDVGLPANVGRLATAARAAGVPVVHCIVHRRDDEMGSNNNGRIFGAARTSGVVFRPGSDVVRLVDEVGDDPRDLVLTRYHGIGGMGGTDLDPVLRNLGARTLVIVGVSVNVGVTNLVMDAVNASYDVVLPRDAIAGVPRAYADAVIDNTLSLLATMTTTDEVVRAWAGNH